MLFELSSEIAPYQKHIFCYANSGLHVLSVANLAIQEPSSAIIFFVVSYPTTTK